MADKEEYEQIVNFADVGVGLILDEIGDNSRKEGLNPIIVWHKNRGIEGWKKMCETYNYVGLTTIGDNLSRENIIAFMNYARKCGTKVHGFAATDSNLIKKARFYSADSTSWKAGSMYGAFYYFDNQKKEIKSVGKEEFKRKHQINFGKLRDRFTDYWNLEQWIKFANYIDS